MASNQQIIQWENQFQQPIDQAAQQWGVPQLLLAQQLYQESGFNPAAQNGNAYGIAQFMPGTAADLGVNPADPISSIFGAAQYDSQLYNKTGSWTGAMQAYGTIPSSGPLSLGQQVVAQIAGGLDSNSSGTGLGLGTGSTGGMGGLGGLGSLSNLLGGLMGSSGSGAASGSGLGGLGGGGGGASFSAWLAEVGERAMLIILGLVLLLGGFYLLGQHSKGEDHIVPVPVPA